MRGGASAGALAVGPNVAGVHLSWPKTTSVLLDRRSRADWLLGTNTASGLGAEGYDPLAVVFVEESCPGRLLHPG